jgi:hypothetical protein
MEGALSENLEALLKHLTSLWFLAQLPYITAWEPLLPQEPKGNLLKF